MEQESKTRWKGKAFIAKCYQHLEQKNDSNPEESPKITWQDYEDKNNWMSNQVLREFRIFWISCKLVSKPCTNAASHWNIRRIIAWKVLETPCVLREMQRKVKSTILWKKHWIRIATSSKTDSKIAFPLNSHIWQEDLQIRHEVFGGAWVWDAEWLKRDLGISSSQKRSYWQQKETLLGCASDMIRPNHHVLLYYMYEEWTKRVSERAPEKNYLSNQGRRTLPSPTFSAVLCVSAASSLSGSQWSALATQN